MTHLRRHRSVRILAMLLALLAWTTWSTPPARAASHREAPLIALDPAADITDVYAFRSWQDPEKVVFIMNVIPGQDPGDGPNYFNFDDNVLYRLHVDINRDGVADDLVYEFRFTTETRPALGSLVFPLPYVGNPSIPVSPLTGITHLDGPGSEGLTRRQTYTVTEMRGGTRTRLFPSQKLIAVPSNVGPATMPSYESLAAEGMFTDVNGIRVFAGQRAETFYIDLGAVFDTVNLRRSPPVLTAAEDANDGANPFGVNRFSGFNVHSIAIEVPITRVTMDGKSAATTASPVIGVYASTSRPKLTVLSCQGGPAQTEGPFVQVARMGNPLVNELLIDTPAKDGWNRAEPASEARFQSFYQNPSVAQALELIFGAFGVHVPATPRTDLMQVLLKYPGQTLAGINCGAPCSELLRLDLRTAPTPPASQHRLGAALSADPAGWPNGRRPNDDVTDIAIRVVGGADYVNARVGDGVNFLDQAPGAGLAEGIGNLLGVTANGITQNFPYLPTPHDGRNRRHADCGEPGANACN